MSFFSQLEDFRRDLWSIVRKVLLIIEGIKLVIGLMIGRIVIMIEILVVV